MYQFSLMVLLLLWDPLGQALEQSGPDLPAGWQVVEPLQPGSEEVHCANSYRTDWGVQFAADSQALVIESLPLWAFRI
jgi:hypothetical protein